MVRVITQEIEIEESLKNKIEFICSFSNTTPIIENGSLRTIERTNLAYVEPHKVIINENIFMFFNDKDIFCINDLNNKFRLCELICYFKKAKSTKYFDFENNYDNINNL